MSSHTSPIEAFNEEIFAQIAADLSRQGYSICEPGLPESLSLALHHHVAQLDFSRFKRAGIGRQTDLAVNDQVRSDEVCWIEGSGDAEQAWLAWTDQLQSYLNRRLFLGLFSFESHFSHYGPGDFYKRHRDAFRGQTNRVLSVVTYLNPAWEESQGGELVIQRSSDSHDTVRVIPQLGTLVIFLSEEFPHEVLPAQTDRYSIAGWYRVNTSSGASLDPPR